MTQEQEEFLVAGKEKLDEVARSAPTAVTTGVYNMTGAQLRRWRTGGIMHALAHLSVEDKCPAGAWNGMFEYGMSLINNVDLLERLPEIY